MKQQELNSRDILSCSSPPTPLTLLFNLLPVHAFLATQSHTAEVTGRLLGTTVAFGYQRQLPQPGEASTSLVAILSSGWVDCGWRRQRTGKLSSAQQPLTTSCYFSSSPRDLLSNKCKLRMTNKNISLVFLLKWLALEKLMLTLKLSADFQFSAPVKNGSIHTSLWAIVSSLSRLGKYHCSSLHSSSTLKGFFCNHNPNCLEAFFFFFFNVSLDSGE